MAKQIKTLELHYQMIQFLIITNRRTQWVTKFKVVNSAFKTGTSRKGVFVMKTWLNFGIVL